LRHSDCAAILALVNLYDSRQPEPSPERVEAWMELHFMQSNDFKTVSRAVTLFYEQPCDPAGRSPYLDTHQLRRFISIAKREKELAATRVQAIEATERQAIEAVQDDRTIAQIIEANPGIPKFEGDPSCDHKSRGLSEGGGMITVSCNRCGKVIAEQASE
jgi:hypothetical protein